MNKWTYFGLSVFAAFAATTSINAHANNLQLIDSNEETGFAIYRSGAPSSKDVAEYCKKGIQEMMVLSGNAKDHEYKYQYRCPSLKVVYNYQQSVNTPLSESFLKRFDEWIETAQREGKKIAFRCDCGCHRTGRLAGYYQMKYQDLSYEEARNNMTRYGKYMDLFPQIYEQLKALRDYVYGQPCSTWNMWCVRER